MEQYWCEPRDRHRLVRNYVANVIFTVIGSDFAEYVQSKINERNQKIAVESNRLLELDEDIAKAFWSSTDVSSR